MPWHNMCHCNVTRWEVGSACVGRSQPHKEHQLHAGSSTCPEWSYQEQLAQAGGEAEPARPKIQRAFHCLEAQNLSDPCSRNKKVGFAFGFLHARQRDDVMLDLAGIKVLAALSVSSTPPSLSLSLHAGSTYGYQKLPSATVPSHCWTG